MPCGVRFTDAAELGVVDYGVTLELGRSDNPLRGRAAYGKTSPGRSPFTWGPTRESYGTDVLYKPNNGNGAPQDDFTEGNFIDYRHFDKAAPNKGDKGAPIYEFGFGLSWGYLGDGSNQWRMFSTYYTQLGGTIELPEGGTMQYQEELAVEAIELSLEWASVPVYLTDLRLHAREVIPVLPSQRQQLSYLVRTWSRPWPGCG